MTIPAPERQGASDADLLAASGADAAAFRVLYDRHCHAVHSFFVRRVPVTADALDMVSETFAQAWLSRQRFLDQRHGDIGPWLYGIARNVLRRSARSAAIESRARARLGMLREPVVTASLEDPANAIDNGFVDTTLGMLAEGQRDAVRLRIVGGADYDEVAARLDCSPATARVRVSRGLDTIRRQMEDGTMGTTHE